MAVDVLEHHYRVVYHHSHGEAHPREAHHVERAPQGLEHYEGSYDARRYGHPDYERAAGAPKEKKQDSHRERPSHHQVRLDEPYGASYVARLLVDVLEKKTLLRQDPGVEFLHGRKKLLLHLYGVSPGFLDDVHRYGGLGVLADGVARVLVAEPDRGHVSQVDRNAAPGRRHYDLFHVAGRSVLPDGSHQVASFALVERPGAPVPVLHVDGARKLRDRDAPPRQLRGVEKNLDPPLPAPEHVRGPHPGHPL